MFVPCVQKCYFNAALYRKYLVGNSNGHRNGGSRTLPGSPAKFQFWYQYLHKCDSDDDDNETNYVIKSFTEDMMSWLLRSCGNYNDYHTRTFDIFLTIPWVIFMTRWNTWVWLFLDLVKYSWNSDFTARFVGFMTVVKKIFRRRNWSSATYPLPGKSAGLTTAQLVSESVSDGHRTTWRRWKISTRTNSDLPNK